MEDIFPDVEQYTSQPLMSMEQLNNAPSQISGFTIPQKRDFHLADMPPSNINWDRLGKSFNDEFATDAELMRLGAENYLNGFSWNMYREIDNMLGGNYRQRKQNYYNNLPEGDWRNTAKIIDHILEDYAGNQSKKMLAKKLKLDKYF